MTYTEVREAWKWTDKFVLSSDNILYYVGPSRRKLAEDQAELSLRLVVSTTMIQEVLQIVTTLSKAGTMRVKQNYYWIGLYVDVEKHVKSCLDCSSKDMGQETCLLNDHFKCPLSKSRRAKAMSDTDMLTVAKVFEECIYRRFGAPSLIRHDRDPRFMSALSRSTLSYRPQANGQQERSVKAVM
ncbi:reverse transcriptase [Phytophthora megakarya]|uniref:Reverse transcriptase n=1 Tax=Phytophthora megakarya TaxID=4795 RepID=A0A225W604_9STRA|nr:reverse transcriptase [Phytophthora megakarya]